MARKTASNSDAARSTGLSPPLYARIAERLREDILKANRETLPPLASLCGRYSVALRTMLKAISVLKEQGVVQVAQGKKTLVNREFLQEIPPGGIRRDTSSGKLYHKIRAAIADGTYKAGQSLPKLKFYVIEERVTDATVCEVFRMLERDGLVHKEGRRWFVGPSKQATQSHKPSIAPSSARPAVLILAPDIRLWNTLHGEELRPFAWQFLDELRRHQLLFEFAQVRCLSVVAREFPEGRGDVLNLINRLGERYRGTLIISYLENLPDLDEWCKWLCQFGKPVVWLDFDNKGQNVDRRLMRRSNFFRLFHHDRAAVVTALQELHSRGHRVVGIPAFGMFRDFEWHVNRTRILKQEAMKLSPEIRLEFADQDEKLWHEWFEHNERATLMYIDHVQSELKKRQADISPGALERAIRTKLRDSVPSLVSLIERKGSTAILSMNQHIGINFFYWLRHAGVRVPADISLVSFDNYPHLSLHPISVVDLGMHNLGYLGAHIFIDDIPVKADRWGNIASTPEFIDRGTLGAARRG